METTWNSVPGVTEGAEEVVIAKSAAEVPQRLTTTTNASKGVMLSEGMETHYRGEELQWRRRSVQVTSSSCVYR